MAIDLSGWLIIGAALILGILAIHAPLRRDARRRPLDRAPLARSAVVDRLPDPYLAFDPSGRLIDANPAARGALGLDAGDTSDQSVESCLGRWPAVVAACRGESEVGVDVTLGEGADARSFGATVTPIREPVGQIAGYAVVLRETTDYRRVERALRESEQQYRTLFENSPDLIVRFDRAFRRVYANATVERLFKVPRERILGLRHRDTPGLPEETAALMEQQIQRVFDTGETLRVPYIRDAVSEGRWLDMLLAPESGADGQVETVLIVTRDVTEQHDLAERLRRLTENLESEVAQRTAELQVSSAELDAFSYSVSHSLRAPLRHMQGFAQAILEEHGEHLDEEGRDFARRVAEAALRLDELIQALTDYARVCRAELRPDPVDLGSEVHEAVADLGLSADDCLDLADLEYAVLADRRTLVRVIRELLDNALKFTRPGETPRVRVWAEAMDGMVRLWVADGGIGIDPRHQERIFGLVEQLRPVGDGEGTGTGLAIVKKGVERMGGRVGVESEPGLGSRFWVELPRAEIRRSSGTPRSAQMAI